ncbi:MAG TPA: hypothetical protein VII76_11185 [Acidimicrobiales bacterium]
MSPTGSFAFRYGALRPLLTVLGMGPGSSRVELEGDTLRVDMGWAFRAKIPVHQITGITPRTGLVGGIGVHGWRGRWLVNGATTGLVVISIDTGVRAWATGIPVRLHELTLSLEDPDAFSVALGR